MLQQYIVIEQLHYCYITEDGPEAVTINQTQDIYCGVGTIYIPRADQFFLGRWRCLLCRSESE